MSDLTKRLRDQIFASDPIRGCQGLEEAVARIEELEAALAEIISMNPCTGRQELPQTKLARAILPDKGEK